jgi:hypothetical protein
MYNDMSVDEFQMKLTNAITTFLNKYNKQYYTDLVIDKINQPIIQYYTVRNISYRKFSVSFYVDELFYHRNMRVFIDIDKENSLEYIIYFDVGILESRKGLVDYCISKESKFSTKTDSFKFITQSIIEHILSMCS